MNYEKLKNLTRIKGLTIKTLAGAVGLTDAGFHKSIKENSFRVDTLEKCAEVLDITVCYFFDCEPGDEKKEGQFREKYFSTLEKYNNQLEINIDLRREIEFLKRRGK